MDATRSLIAHCVACLQIVHTSELHGAMFYCNRHSFELYDSLSIACDFFLGIFSPLTCICLICFWFHRLAALVLASR